MKRKLYFVPAILSFLLLAAHFSRTNQVWLSYLCLVLPLLLIAKKKWLQRVLQLLLVIGGIIWIETTYRLINIRMVAQASWLRLAIILGVVSLFTFWSAYLLRLRE